MYIFDPLEAGIDLLKFSPDPSDMAGDRVGLHIALAGDPL